MSADWMPPLPSAGTLAGEPLAWTPDVEQAMRQAMADLVIIEWEDSRRPDGCWKHLSGDHAWEPVKCASVGWLVADDPQKKVLAPNMGDIDDASNMQMSGEIVIPTSCVLSVKRLTETSVTSASARMAVASTPKQRPT